MGSLIRSPESEPSCRSKCPVAAKTPVNSQSLRVPANVAGDTTLRLIMTLQRKTPEEDVDSSSVGPTSNRAGGTS